MKINILISENGYESLYVNGMLIDEGEELGEGNSKIYLLEKSEEYGFGSKDVTINQLTEEDESYLEDWGCFPREIEDLSGKYLVD
jgi:hypothetical protein